MLSAQLGSGWGCPQWQGQLAFCPVLHPTLPLGSCLSRSSHVLLLGTGCHQLKLTLSSGSVLLGFIQNSSSTVAKYANSGFHCQVQCFTRTGEKGNLWAVVERLLPAVDGGSAVNTVVNRSSTQSRLDSFLLRSGPCQKCAKPGHFFCNSKNAAIEEQLRSEEGASQA